MEKLTKSPVEKLTNGLSSELSDDSIVSPSVQKSLSEGRLKSPQIPKVPISPHIRFEPSKYKYVVEGVLNAEQQTVRAFLLNRPKGVLTPKKLRVFLRNATYRASEKQPFVVKVTFPVDVCFCSCICTCFSVISFVFVVGECIVIIMLLSSF